MERYGWGEGCLTTGCQSHQQQLQKIGEKVFCTMKTWYQDYEAYMVLLRAGNGDLAWVRG